MIGRHVQKHVDVVQGRAWVSTEVVGLPLAGVATDEQNVKAALDCADGGQAREVDRVARSGEPALLLALDIDFFKRVNDTYGHGAGDQVIRAVAHALLDCVRPMDLVARLGGDEFVVMLEGLDASPAEAASADAEASDEDKAKQRKPKREVIVPAAPQVLTAKVDRLTP